MRADDILEDIRRNAPADSWTTVNVGKARPSRFRIVCMVAIIVNVAVAVVAYLL